MAGFSNITSDESIVYADNASFDGTERGGKMTTNGQLWIGSTVSPHVRLGSLTSSGGTIAITPGAGFINLELTGGGAATEHLTGDTGGTLNPDGSNNFNILGGPGVTVAGSGSTLTINSMVFTNTAATTMAVDNGYFATAAGTYNLPATAAQGEMITVICDTAGAVVIDAPALNFIRIGAAITAASGTATSTSIGDSVTLRYRLSSLTWEATSVIGTWLVV